MTSFVDVADDIRILPDTGKLLEEIVSQISESENCPYEVCVSLYITASEEVKSLNREYRGIDDTTDVLSFPALSIDSGDFDAVDEEDVSLFDPDSGELIIGDIVINYDRVISQAKLYGHSEKRELAFLIAHSVYHLFGYDHLDAESAGVMEAKQEETLNALGITRD